jgi:hypothetical protein
LAFILFADRLDKEIVAEYTNHLIERAREVEGSSLVVKDGCLRQINGGNIQKIDPWSLHRAVVLIRKWWQQLLSSAMNTLTEPASYGVDKKNAEAVMQLVFISQGPGKLTHYTFSFRIFDPHMDEYLGKEVEAVKRSFDSICRNRIEKVIRTFL